MHTTLLFMVQWPMVTADSFPPPSPDRHGIGWFEGTLESQGFEIDVRVAYPAETDGEGAVASNGTFPTLMWCQWMVRPTWITSGWTPSPPMG